MTNELIKFLNEARTKHQRNEDLVKYLFLYVRDSIKFDFLIEMDNLNADEVFKLKLGQCNNKTVLLFEMLNYFNFNVFAHFSTIQREIHRGFFPWWLLFFTPKEIGHSWIEVEINGKMVVMDGYINDQYLYEGSVLVNKTKGWSVGHSVAEGECGSSTDFSLEGSQFVQMGAVRQDLGLSKEPLVYLQSSKNPNQVNFIKRFFYKLALKGMRKRVRKVRRMKM